MFFKKSKKAEPVENISTHKELTGVLTYASQNRLPLVLSTSDTSQFNTMRDTLSDNIGKNCIYKCENGAINLKYFCMVTFIERDVVD